MSRFFDLLQRLNQQKSHASSASLETANEDTDVATVFDRTLSLLLPNDVGYPENKQKRSDPNGPMSVLVPQDKVFGAIQNTSVLERIEVEVVHVQPASRIIFHTEPNGPAADRFRLVRMRLRVLWNATKLRTLLITSPLPGDGKSTIALNLATALAERGRRNVLLIDADLHRSPLTQQLGLRAGPGLAECLESDFNPLSAVRHLEPLGWYLLPAGAPNSNATELLQGDRLSAVMQALSPHFDWIVIDSPPVIPLTDALSLGRLANGSLLVTMAGRTPIEAIEKAIGLLGREHVLGVVLNGVEELNKLYSEYYGYLGKNSTPAELSIGMDR